MKKKKKEKNHFLKKITFYFEQSKPLKTFLCWPCAQKAQMAIDMERE